jgi:3-oxoadipate enol-lactonase
LEDCADDVAALAEALGISRLIPVGYSMGGPVAQLTWRRHPELVSGLVLCATARRFSSRRPAERAFFSSMLGLSLAARIMPGAVRRQVVDGMVRRRMEAGPLSRWAVSELARNDPAAILQAGSAIGGFDSRGWLGEVGVPTSVVVTALDQVVRPSSQLALANSIPGAKVFTVQGDHGACAMVPKLFVPTLFEACRAAAAQASA